jgi:ribokinase
VPTPTPRVAVVGHVEWAEFARVERLPAPGEIVHAHEAFQAPAGGGAVAAVQLARLAGDCLFLTALADDELGHRAGRELEALGVDVEAARRPGSQRRALVHLDGNGERTITVIGERLGPRRDDPLPWPRLGSCDAVYLTAGDAGAVRAARAARSLVATVRAIDALATAGVELDVLVASGEDAGERYSAGDIDPSPRFAVRTAGALGGSLETAAGRQVHWEAPPLPGPAIDTYGAGDSFAAGLTYGLALELSPEEAVTLGSRCGAACVTGRGPYEGQLRGPVAP